MAEAPSQPLDDCNDRKGIVPLVRVAKATHIGSKPVRIREPRVGGSAETVCKGHRIESVRYSISFIMTIFISIPCVNGIMNTNTGAGWTIWNGDIWMSGHLLGQHGLRLHDRFADFRKTFHSDHFSWPDAGRLDIQVRSTYSPSVNGNAGRRLPYQHGGTGDG